MHDLQQDRVDLSRLLMAQSKLNLQYMQQKRLLDAKKERLRVLDKMMNQSLESFNKVYLY